jgi:hypothetical protein
MMRGKPQDFLCAKASRRICKLEALDRRKNRAHGRTLPRELKKALD